MVPLIIRNELSPSFDGYKTNNFYETWLWN